MSEQMPILQSIQNQFRDLASSLPASADRSLFQQNLRLLERRVQAVLEMYQNEVGALMGVGQLVNSSRGLKVVLEEVMDTLIRLMQAERGFLMLKDDSGELALQTARGVNKNGPHEEVFSGSHTIIRTVIETGKPTLTTNAQNDPRFEMQQSVAILQLRSVLCAPLKLKDELIGVIYVDHRGMPDMFHESDMNIISAFADQAAVAIDNARLFENLKAANEELKIAYEATLQGWVRALDLRDKETEGHTQRVTSLARSLGERMGLSEADLIHVTRGALLHDIGKMGISDIILHKPEGLTEEERAVIRQHPALAYEMLKPIQFLHPAIEIPYCHHEKWDGSGYPRGLKEEEIPLGARIFAVVDVWDALTSDRVYRKALHPEDVRAQLREQAGHHFDPRVVDSFIELTVSS
jgi:putative nucleotidyltransferase with HDIG domain